MNTHKTPQIGVVVIGRNEGERLERCLRSVIGRVDHMVYVDSGSTDGSVALAKGMGVTVVDLDLSRPFTMARGRNEGFERLREMAPATDFVQFIDGDCEVVDGWIERASQTLVERSDVVAVAGFRSERFPEHSIYNKLCDMEWAGPVGEVSSVGGDVMMRMGPLSKAGGFNEAMIAGEEGELCVRLRAEGWKVLRIDAAMTLHDAAMTRLGQWFKRTMRAGHAYAEGALMHGRSAERYNVRPVLSALAWGVVMPVLWLMSLVIAGVWPAFVWGIAVVPLVTAVSFLRMVLRRRFVTGFWGDSALFCAFCMLAKLPQAWGVAWFFQNRLRGRRSGLIEYKTASADLTQEGIVS